MKLLPCPCCGSSDIYAGVAHAFGYHVKCNTCGLRTRDFNLPDFSGKKNWPQRLTFRAMKAWNMRQPIQHNVGISHGDGSATPPTR